MWQIIRLWIDVREILCLSMRKVFSREDHRRSSMLIRIKETFIKILTKNHLIFFLGKVEGPMDPADFFVYSIMSIFLSFSSTGEFKFHPSSLSFSSKFISSERWIMFLSFFCLFWIPIEGKATFLSFWIDVDIFDLYGDLLLVEDCRISF